MTRLTWWPIRVATSAAFFGVLIGLVSMIDSGYEMTQMRNAFIASGGLESDFYWSVGEPPQGFLQESGPTPHDFEKVVAGVLSSGEARETELERTLTLARHLAGGPGPGSGVKSDTLRTYRTIRSERRGYCSDYTQVMNGLAFAADIPIREWGLSFDNYSGNGHGFSEIYDRVLDKWVFVDSFYSFYVVDVRSKTPLSVLEFRERLAKGEGTDTLEVRTIEPARFGFKSPERALEYYRDGSDGFFLYFGNNVFSYDRNPLVSFLGPFSRAAEETAGIFLGIRPEIRLIRTATNESSIDALLFRRNLFIFLSIAATLMFVLLVAQAVAIRRRRRFSPDLV